MTLQTCGPTVFERCGESPADWKVVQGPWQLPISPRGVLRPSFSNKAFTDNHRLFVWRNDEWVMQFDEPDWWCQGWLMSDEDWLVVETTRQTVHVINIHTEERVWGFSGREVYVREDGQLITAKSVHPPHTQLLYTPTGKRFECPPNFRYVTSCFPIVRLCDGRVGPSLYVDLRTMEPTTPDVFRQHRLCINFRQDPMIRVMCGEDVSEEGCEIPRCASKTVRQGVWLCQSQVNGQWWLLRKDHPPVALGNVQAIGCSSRQIVYRQEERVVCMSV